MRGRVGEIRRWSSVVDRKKVRRQGQTQQNRPGWGKKGVRKGDQRRGDCILTQNGHS